MVATLPSQNGAGNDNPNVGGVVNLDTIRCTILERYTHNGSTNLIFPHGMVIDDACSKEWLIDSVQAMRKALPLNHKRPTVDRRFYCDTTRNMLCRPLESIVRHAMKLAEYHNVGASSTNMDGDNNLVVYCNKYLRFLEYNTVGGELLPHRDGTKTCEDTGIKSTHTLLLFLSDCEFGGETLIMDDGSNVTGESRSWAKETNLVLYAHHNQDENQNIDNNQSDPSTCKSLNNRRIRYVPINIDSGAQPPDTAVKSLSKTKVFCLRDATFRTIDSYVGNENEQDHGESCPHPRHISIGIQPTEGRILLFPHHWPHAGAMCQSVPKIALRAELTISKPGKCT